MRATARRTAARRTAVSVPAVHRAGLVDVPERVARTGEIFATLAQ
ncbi:hypothetical protein [Streptomyces sp. RKAG290]|nr:hypothetical protein [Streptomyces sp. RKAG290]